jgi:hypothetical protein
VLFCAAVACLVVAAAMVPWYVWQLRTVHRFWGDARSEVAGKLGSGTLAPEQVGAALLRSMRETEDANVRAARNRAMEIEALLIVPGILLLVFRHRERRLRALLRKGRDGTER